MLSLPDNPVFRREARSRLRHVRRSVKSQVIAAALLVVLITLCYAIILRMAIQLRIVGDELWMWGSWIQFVAGVTILPAVAATAICVERQQGSLDLLLATPLSNADIVAGKYFARMTLAAMMVAAGMPFQLVALLRGGLRLEVAAMSSLIVVVTLLAVGALSIACSAVFRMTATAVGVAYVVVVAWMALPPLLGAAIGELWWSGSRAAQFAVGMSPVGALAWPLSYGAGYGSPHSQAVLAGAGIGLFLTLLVAVGSLRLTAAFLRKG